MFPPDVSSTPEYAASKRRLTPYDNGQLPLSMSCMPKSLASLLQTTGDSISTHTEQRQNDAHS